MLPPSVAPTQVVLVPIISSVSTGGDSRVSQDEKILEKLYALAGALRDSGVRCYVDAREDVRPGAKYFEWERKGVPLRLVIGARDLSHGNVTVVERVGGKKEVISSKEEDVVAHVEQALASVQNALYGQAKARLASRIHRVQSYAQMKQMLKDAESDHSSGGLFLVPWKDCEENELRVKEECKATLRCYPYDENQDPPSSGVLCFFCNEQATHMALFARAF